MLAVFALITQLVGSSIIVAACVCVLCAASVWMVWTRGLPLPPPAPTVWREKSPVLFPLEYEPTVEYEPTARP